jgi:hypothetical protein
MGIFKVRSIFLKNSSCDTEFSLWLFYLNNDTKRIRHKFYQLIESSPIYTIIITLIENAQENKKNKIVSCNKAENSKRIKRNEEKVCVCVFGCWMVFG